MEVFFLISRMYLAAANTCGHLPSLLAGEVRAFEPTTGDQLFVRSQAWGNPDRRAVA